MSLQSPKKHININIILILFVFVMLIFVLILFISTDHIGGTLPRNFCSSLTAFSCTNPIMHPNGTFSFTFAQYMGTLYNVHFACSTSVDNDGQPIANTNPYYSLSNMTSGVHNNTLISNYYIHIKNLPCYGQNGMLLGLQPIGKPINGYVWINYTTAPQVSAINNSWTASRVIWIQAVNVT